MAVGVSRKATETEARMLRQLAHVTNCLPLETRESNGEITDRAIALMVEMEETTESLRESLGDVLRALERAGYCGADEAGGPHASTFIDDQAARIAELEAQSEELVAAAQNFVWKVDSGRAISVDSYGKFKRALAAREAAKS